MQNVCENCDAFNPQGSHFCSRCGSRLYDELQEPTYPYQEPLYQEPPQSEYQEPTYSYQEPPYQEPQPPAYQEPQRTYSGFATSCPRCRQVNEPGSAYCYSCGLPLDEAADTHTPQYQYRPYSVGQTASPQQSYAGAPPAGFWIRLVAALIDTAILIGIWVLLAAILPGVSAAEYFDNFGLNWDSDFDFTWFDWAEVAFNALYSAILVSTLYATVGKLVFGMKVVRTDGTKVGFGRALARWALFYISAIAFGLLFLVIAFRKDKRGVHDLICGTMVVRQQG